jgi:hypothetical protein
MSLSSSKKYLKYKTKYSNLRNMVGGGIEQIKATIEGIFSMIDSVKIDMVDFNNETKQNTTEFTSNIDTFFKKIIQTNHYINQKMDTKIKSFNSAIQRVQSELESLEAIVKPIEERKEQENKDRVAKLVEAVRKTKEQKAQLEAARKAQEEADRQAAEAYRQAQLEATRKAQEEVDRQVAEAARKAQEAAKAKQVEDARKAEADRTARVAQEKAAQIEEQIRKQIEELTKQNEDADLDLKTDKTKVEQDDKKMSTVTDPNEKKEIKNFKLNTYIKSANLIIANKKIEKLKNLINYNKAIYDDDRTSALTYETNIKALNDKIIDLISKRLIAQKTLNPDNKDRFEQEASAEKSHIMQETTKVLEDAKNRQVAIKEALGRADAAAREAAVREAAAAAAREAARAEAARAEAARAEAARAEAARADTAAAARREAAYRAEAAARAETAARAEEAAREAARETSKPSSVQAPVLSPTPLLPRSMSFKSSSPLPRSSLQPSVPRSDNGLVSITGTFFPTSSSGSPLTNRSFQAPSPPTSTRDDKPVVAESQSSIYDELFKSSKSSVPTKGSSKALFPPTSTRDDKPVVAESQSSIYDELFKSSKSSVPTKGFARDRTPVATNPTSYDLL